MSLKQLFEKISRKTKAEDVPICPRRHKGLPKKPSDTWQINRWNNVEWKWGEIPRSCSFCGGLHPEDVLRLIEEGWEPEKTDKRYKAYLHPPGHKEHVRFLFDSIVYKKPVKENNYTDPVPCVKVYFQHFTDQQMTKYSEIVG